MHGNLDQAAAVITLIAVELVLDLISSGAVWGPSLLEHLLHFIGGRAGGVCVCVCVCVCTIRVT